MNQEEVMKQLDALRDGEIQELYVRKEDFLGFQPLLVRREDFKHFRGVAGRGGHFTYYYTETPRS
ncbi:hypothetical protein ACR3I8_00340 [Priestia flexa]